MLNGGVQRVKHAHMISKEEKESGIQRKSYRGSTELNLVLANNPNEAKKTKQKKGKEGRETE